MALKAHSPNFPVKQKITSCRDSLEMSSNWRFWSPYFHFVIIDLIYEADAGVKVKKNTPLLIDRLGAS